LPFVEIQKVDLTVFGNNNLMPELKVVIHLIIPVIVPENRLKIKDIAHQHFIVRNQILMRFGM
jgi:hypothetical protein